MVDRQIQNLRMALREHPNHADWYYRLGVLLRHRGRLDEAIRAFRSAVRINPQYIKALTKLGFALRDAGEADEAIRVWQQVLKIDPTSVDLHYQLGLIFADRREFENALDGLEQAVDADRRTGRLSHDGRRPSARSRGFRQAGGVRRRNAAGIDRLVCGPRPPDSSRRATRPHA